MNEKELMKIWQKSSDMESIKINLPLLISELRNKMENIDRIIKNRDKREIIGSVFGGIIYLFFAVYIPFLWTKIASVMMIAWFAYVIYRLKKTSSDSKPEPSLPLIKQLNARKQYLLKQQKLLENVAYWYLLPPFLINILFFFGVEDPTTWDSPIAFILPESIASKILIIVYLIALYYFIFRMNRKAAKTTYNPLIESINQVKEELENEIPNSTN